MHLRFFSQDDSGVVLDELFSISLSGKEFHEFLLKTNGGNIAIRKPLMMKQGFFVIEGADWTNGSEIIIKPREQGNDLIFLVNGNYLGILLDYARISENSDDSIGEIGKLIEAGIRLLISA
jgi:hypothetical protein